MLYNRGVYNSVLIAEAIAEAQKITGKKAVTGEDVRRGLENLNLDAARFKALGLDGFAVPFKTTCADHNSHSATFVQQWDGAKWTKVSDLVAPDAAKVQPLLDEAAKSYAEKNAGWPARTEPATTSEARRPHLRPSPAGGRGGDSRLRDSPPREGVSAPSAEKAARSAERGAGDDALRLRSSTSSTSRSSTTPSRWC